MFEIDCEEIFLREFSIEDVDAIYELTSQPEVYEFLPDWRSTKEQRANWVQTMKFHQINLFCQLFRTSMIKGI